MHIWKVTSIRTDVPETLQNTMRIQGKNIKNFRMRVSELARGKQKELSLKHCDCNSQNAFWKLLQGSTCIVHYLCILLEVFINRYTEEHCQYWRKMRLLRTESHVCLLMQCMLRKETKLPHWIWHGKIFKTTKNPTQPQNITATWKDFVMT